MSPSSFPSKAPEAETPVLMPAMGSLITEGTITRWLVAEGETVERDQPLLEASSEKVDLEIRAPVSGKLLRILRQEGETVPANEVVGLIEVEGGTPAGGAHDPASRT